MKYFFGTHQAQSFISNFTDEVGILWDERDLNFVLPKLPAPPVIFWLEQLVAEQKGISLLEELKEAMQDFATQRKKKQLFEIDFDIAKYPVITTLLEKIFDPVCVYDSTLLPFLKTHFTTRLLPPSAPQMLSRFMDTESPDFVAIMSGVGSLSILDLMMKYGELTYALLSTYTPRAYSVFGQITHTLLMEVSSAIIHDTDFGKKDELFHDKNRQTKRRLLRELDSAFDRAVNSISRVFSQKKLVTGHISSGGYSIIPSAMRKQLQLAYDGAVRSAKNIVSGPIMLNNEPAGIRFNLNGELWPLYPGIHTVGGPTATGKSTIVKFLQDINPHIAFDTIDVSEPHRDAYLGMEGLNSALAQAIDDTEHQVIVIDSASDILVTAAKGQPLTSKGVSWKLREILNVLNTIAALAGKVIILIFNVEESQSPIYTELFRGVSIVDYLPLANSWQIVYREFGDHANRHENKVMRNEIATVLQLDSFTRASDVFKQSSEQLSFEHDTSHLDLKFLFG